MEVVRERELAVQAPPPIPKSAPVNPLARLLPAAMLVAAVGMMVVYFTSGAAATRGPMYMFFPVMMVGSVVGTLAYGARGTNRTAEINRDRQTYLRYLDTFDSVIAVATDDQRRSLQWRHPEPASLWCLAGGTRMWERTPGDPDFCLVRVGHGERPLATPLKAPVLDAVDELDPVTVNAMRRLVRQRTVVPDLPITIALSAVSTVDVNGERHDARALVRSMVCQLAVLHGPEHVAIAAVTGPESRDEWDWLKWLPHHAHSRAVDAAGPTRRVYGTLTHALNDATAPEKARPQHVVVIVDAAATAGTGQAGPEAGVTAVYIAPDHAPSGGGLRLHVDGGCLTMRVGDREEAAARPDSLTLTQALVCARRLAPYRPAASATSAQQSGLGWLGLMRIDDPHAVDPDACWTRHGVQRILPVPVGVSHDGTPVEVDINEAARNGMGPHGLCVGATGSGKSEFLRTLALGMITAHSPDDLNLILVDFKGGATFLGLQRAHHVAAVITNLADEAHLVNRMNDALAGEMNRRQELLRAAGRFANVSEYEHARAQGVPLPALPALFIMVDEFSELLSQHPDFAELFVAIGRVGRSLGMHLLLASQRLDEGRLRGLETHLSYRICLKTFSASESRAVLGIPDAHHLPGTPGAAYLKTASGELVRFQTAFVSGPLEAGRDDLAGPTTTLPTPVVFTAAPVGQIVDPAQVGDEDGASTPTVLDAVLDRLAGHGPPARRVWLPPLTESPTLDAILREEGPRRLAVPIGLVDNPYEQRRDRLLVELAGAAGNVAVVGAPRSGKSMTLRTLLLALAETHGPEEVGFYCLDFGGGVLSSLRRLPHMGSVAGRSDVDLCRRTIAVVETLLRAREARHAAGEVSATEDPFGEVFLVIDGWATLRQDFEAMERSITAIAAQGLSFGVHVVVAASRWAELRPGLKDQIATRIELRLGDPAESEMDRRRARALANRPQGHGITADGREMVIASPGCEVAESIERLRARWNGRCTPPIELLPLRVHREEAACQLGERRPKQVLIGIGERELSPVALDFAQQSHLLVLGEGACGKTSVLRLLCQEIMCSHRADEAQLEIVDFRRTLLGVVDTDHLAGYSMSPVSLSSRLPKILERLHARMPGENVTQQQLRTRSWWTGPEIFLVIDDYDLVAGSTGNPLAPLADFLPHAQDLGLHVLVTRRSGGAARAMFDPVLARLRELGCAGLMMSASTDEGVLLGSTRPSPLPAGRATLVSRGDADQLIQVAWTDPP